MSQPLPTEIVVLGLSVVLLVAQVFLQAMLSNLERGIDYNGGPRDEDVPIKGVYAGRADRALRNLLETYPAFVALALALVATGQTGGWGAIGAQVWLAMRVIFVPLYLLGIPIIRSVIWLIALCGLAAMLMRLFQ